ncbi:MAG: MarR family winged helix-turn-helix transcriptional regulator [Kofleriaceae bacterium]
MIPEDDVAQEILRSIRQVIRGISIHSKQLFREVGLTVPQMVCLRAIFDLETAHEEVTVMHVSQRVQLSPPTVSRIVDRLAAADLVTRARSSTDRRKVLMALTPTGLERIQTSPSPLQETFLHGLATLPPEDRLELLAAVRRIAVLMNAADLDAAPLLTPGDDVKD